MKATIDRPRELSGGLQAQLRSLQAENDRLRASNQRLSTENHALRAALDAHVRRARSAALFGPLELTAGTCVGPRRRRA